MSEPWSSSGDEDDVFAPPVDAGRRRGGRGGSRNNSNHHNHHHHQHNHNHQAVSSDHQHHHHPHGQRNGSQKRRPGKSVGGESAIAGNRSSAGLGVGFLGVPFATEDDLRLLSDTSGAESGIDSHGELMLAYQFDDGLDLDAPVSTTISSPESSKSRGSSARNDMGSAADDNDSEDDEDIDGVADDPSGGRKSATESELALNTAKNATSIPVSHARKGMSRMERLAAIVNSSGLASNRDDSTMKSNTASSTSSASPSASSPSTLTGKSSSSVRIAAQPEVMKPAGGSSVKSSSSVPASYSHSVASVSASSSFGYAKEIGRYSGQRRRRRWANDNFLHLPKWLLNRIHSLSTGSSSGSPLRTMPSSLPLTPADRRFLAARSSIPAWPHRSRNPWNATDPFPPDEFDDFAPPSSSLFRDLLDDTAMLRFFQREFVHITPDEEQRKLNTLNRYRTDQQQRRRDDAHADRRRRVLEAQRLVGREQLALWEAWRRGESLVPFFTADPAHESGAHRSDRSNTIPGSRSDQVTLTANAEDPDGSAVDGGDCCGFSREVLDHTALQWAGDRYQRVSRTGRNVLRRCFRSPFLLALEDHVVAFRSGHGGPFLPNVMNAFRGGLLQGSTSDSAHDHESTIQGNNEDAADSCASTSKLSGRGDHVSSGQSDSSATGELALGSDELFSDSPLDAGFVHWVLPNPQSSTTLAASSEGARFSSTGPGIGGGDGFAVGLVFPSTSNFHRLVLHSLAAYYGLSARYVAPLPSKHAGPSRTRNAPPPFSEDGEELVLVLRHPRVKDDGSVSCPTNESKDICETGSSASSTDRASQSSRPLRYPLGPPLLRLSQYLERCYE